MKNDNKSKSLADYADSKLFRRGEPLQTEDFAEYTEGCVWVDYCGVAPHSMRGVVPAMWTGVAYMHKTAGSIDVTFVCADGGLINDPPTRHTVLMSPTGPLHLAFSAGSSVEVVYLYQIERKDYEVQRYRVEGQKINESGRGAALIVDGKRLMYSAYFRTYSENKRAILASVRAHE